MIHDGLPNYGLELTARLFLAERPQLKRSVSLASFEPDYRGGAR